MRFTFARTLLPTLLILIMIGTPLATQAAPSPQGSDPAGLENQLLQATGGKVRITRHPTTGKVNYIGADTDAPVGRPALLPAQANPEQLARAYMDQYGALFGLKQQAQELRVQRINAANGRSTVRFQQVYQNIPVLGGEINLNLDAQGNLLAAIGEVAPDLALNVKPTVDPKVAQQRASETVAKNHELKAEDLVASQPELWIYDSTLLGGPGLRKPALVWRMEVTPTRLLPIRELVLVDAQRGNVALHFNQIHEARDRKTYTANNTSALPGTLKCVETTTNCSPGEADARLAHLYAGQTYDFYKSRHNRDSINNRGMAIISTVDYCPDSFNCPFANAFWNGQQMVYGDTYAAADDVVGHELTHGVTDFESGLFYYYQSGAINEALSDIWGEFVDLTNGRGNDTAAVRWLMGEDLPIGAIRNMKNPGAFGDPDRMRSPNYWASPDDAGGVHSNSGVANKAAFLMTDGGTFNGRTVAALGIDKVAKIWYEAQVNLLVSGSDYFDLYNALRQACANLVGTSGITSANCQQVKNAVDATEMNLQPNSAAAKAVEAPVCAAGQTPTNIFFDRFEQPATNTRWVKQTILASGGNRFYYPQNTHPYPGYDATYATSGVYNVWGDDVDTTSDSAFAMRNGVVLPANAFLHFRHAYGFEAGFSYYDGGVLEYSVNGGAWRDAGSLFVNNGYNVTLSSLNPMGARRAFGGESHGYYSSRLNLGTLAGQNVKFRFRIGTDVSTGDYGWFIDDVRIYTCGS